MKAWIFKIGEQIMSEPLIVGLLANALTALTKTQIDAFTLQKNIQKLLEGKEIKLLDNKQNLIIRALSQSEQNGNCPENVRNFLEHIGRNPENQRECLNAVLTNQDEPDDWFVELCSLYQIPKNSNNASKTNDDPYTVKNLWRVLCFVVSECSSLKDFIEQGVKNLKEDQKNTLTEVKDVGEKVDTVNKKLDRLVSHKDSSEGDNNSSTDDNSSSTDGETKLRKASLAALKKMKSQHENIYEEFREAYMNEVYEDYDSDTNGSYKTPKALLDLILEKTPTALFHALTKSLDFWSDKIEDFKKPLSEFFFSILPISKIPEVENCAGVLFSEAPIVSLFAPSRTVLEVGAALYDGGSAKFKEDGYGAHCLPDVPTTSNEADFINAFETDLATHLVTQGRLFGQKYSTKEEKLNSIRSGLEQKFEYGGRRVYYVAVFSQPSEKEARKEFYESVFRQLKKKYPLVLFILLELDTQTIDKIPVHLIQALL